MNTAIEFANDKVDELFKKLSAASLREVKLLLTLGKVKNIIESGMNNTQKLDYIKNALTVKEE